MSNTEQSKLTSHFRVKKKRNYASSQTNLIKLECKNNQIKLSNPFLSVENDGEKKMNQKPAPIIKKARRNRFGDLTEAEVLARGLPDLLKNGLDIVIVGINPGLTAAYVGHHYAGPGNHFWKCLHLSGLTKEQLNAKRDGYVMQEYSIGFTNIVKRTSRGSSDISRREIKEGADTLRERLSAYRPLIVAFNGKGIYEVFRGNKDFPLGRQPEKFGTSEVFVMPSSSARCSQLPRAVDKVPYYVALRELRDYLKGDKTICVDRLVFPDVQLKVKKRDVPNNERKNEEIKIKKESTLTTHASIYFPSSHNTCDSKTPFKNGLLVKEEKELDDNTTYNNNYSCYFNNNNNNNLNIFSDINLFATTTTTTKTSNINNNTYNLYNNNTTTNNNNIHDSNTKYYHNNINTEIGHNTTAINTYNNSRTDDDHKTSLHSDNLILKEEDVTAKRVKSKYF